MTIRTIEEHKKLNTQEKMQYSKYLPISLAYFLPLLFRTFADVSNMNDEKSCRAEMAVINAILDSDPNLRVQGFRPFHRCKLEYHENVRTFCEANSKIDGKPSIGIQFCDADDGYNDWVWVAVEVIKNFNDYKIVSYDMSEIQKLHKIKKELRTMKPDNEILLKCECSSSEHQMIVFWDNKEEDVYVSVHLSSYRNFWQRLWYGLKYAFGYKCRYGAFDEVILRKEDADEIQKVVDHLKEKGK